MPRPISRNSIAALALSLPLILSACQTLAGSQVATVDLGDTATRAAVTSALAQAVNRAHVELGPTDADETSVLTVLPPPLSPLETNSTAVPIRFDIVRRGGKCFAVRSDTKAAYELPGVHCNAVARTL